MVEPLLGHYPVAAAESCENSPCIHTFTHTFTPRGISGQWKLKESHTNTRRFCVHPLQHRATCSSMTIFISADSDAQVTHWQFTKTILKVRLVSVCLFEFQQIVYTHTLPFFTLIRITQFSFWSHLSSQFLYHCQVEPEAYPREHKLELHK